MKKVILGIDISSTTIGWGALLVDEEEKTIKLLKSGFFKPSKDGHVLDRLYDTKQKMLDIMSDTNPDIIVIEDIVKFMKKSTASTVVMLASFNRTLCMLAYDFLMKKPELVNVMSVRHGLKFSKILMEKKEMPEVVAKHLGIKFPYIKDKTGKIKLKKNKEVVDENVDMADGIAAGLYFALKYIGKIKGKKDGS